MIRYKQHKVKILVNKVLREIHVLKKAEMAGRWTNTTINQRL